VCILYCNIDLFLFVALPHMLSDVVCVCYVHVMCASALSVFEHDLWFVCVWEGTTDTSAKRQIYLLVTCFDIPDFKRCHGIKDVYS